MIGILDYGLGNIKSFSNIYKSFDIPFKVIIERKQLNEVTKLILPGVGAFDDAMKKFNNSGLRDSVEKMVFEKKTPVLGVCVGLQMLGLASEEGNQPGLGWVNSEINLFDKSKISFHTKLPHMGWNSIDIKKERDGLFKNINNGDRFYFLHSYYCECQDKNEIIAISSYGVNFACAIKSKNIYGVQFHPEKSLKNGQQLLINFAKL